MCPKRLSEALLNPWSIYLLHLDDVTSLFLMTGDNCEAGSVLASHWPQPRHSGSEFKSGHIAHLSSFETNDESYNHESSFQEFLPESIWSAFRDVAAKFTKLMIYGCGVGWCVLARGPGLVQAGPGWPLAAKTASDLEPQARPQPRAWPGWRGGGCPPPSAPVLPPGGDGRGGGGYLLILYFDYLPCCRGAGLTGQAHSSRG